MGSRSYSRTGGSGRDLAPRLVVDPLGRSRAHVRTTRAAEPVRRLADFGNALDCVRISL